MTLSYHHLHREHGPLLMMLSDFSSFSGSHIENWHSILRNGLVSASYTKLQVYIVLLTFFIVNNLQKLKRQFQHMKLFMDV